MKKEEKEEIKEKDTTFKPAKSKETFDAEEYLKKRKSKKIKIIASIVVVVAIFVLSIVFALINMTNENILNGISIQGIDVSGMKKEEAIQKIKETYEAKQEKDIEVKYQDYESAIDLKILEINYNIEDAVNEAVGKGRNSNIFVNNFEIIKTFFTKEDIPLEFTINEEVAKQTIEDIGAKLPGILEESSYYIEEESLFVDKGKAGIVVDTDKMLETIKEEAINPTQEQEILEIPTIQKNPTEIDIQKIHDEVYTEVKDAYYTKEVVGIDFDVEAAKTILAEEGKEEYVIPLILTQPKVTLSQIGTEAFPDQLATFTTKYDASNKDRTTNLRIACQKINGKVLLPGETFSYNKTLGKRTAEAGYRNGKVYENGQVVDGIGGGICQISSTLYNTALLANMEIVERRNHQFVTSYLPAGRDATVVYGSTDFQFKNPRKYPVQIKASINNGVATVTMFGIKEEEEYTISFSTKTISTIPPTIKYENDPSLPAGQEKVKQAGSNGLVTETTITKKLNGKVVSSKLLSKDTYSAMQKIIARGTGGAKAETSTQAAQPAQQAPAETQPAQPVQPTPAPQVTEPEQEKQPGEAVQTTN